MDEADGHGALSDRRCDPADHVGPYVTGGEDPRYAGLQKIGIPLQRPGGAPGAVDEQIGSGENESPLVAFNDALLRSRSAGGHR